MGFIASIHTRITERMPPDARALRRGAVTPLQVRMARRLIRLAEKSGKGSSVAPRLRALAALPIGDSDL